jgi:hypothetical protein
MCNFKSVGDAAAVAIATMHSGIQVYLLIFLECASRQLPSVFVLN